MGFVVGQTTWQAPCLVKSLAVGCSVLGGTLICKSAGVAWIVAPPSTHVTGIWTDGLYCGIDLDRCCVCDWPSVQIALCNAGFNPSQWFIPSRDKLFNPGYVCRSLWCTCNTSPFWASTDFSANDAGAIAFDNGAFRVDNKANNFNVRAFRCISY